MELLGGDRRRRGVSVDAVALYLERLPPLALGRTFNAAVVGFSPHNATLPVYFIHPRDILARALPEWLRGSNTVGTPSWQQVGVLKAAGAGEGVLRTAEVRALSISALLVRLNGCRVALLKLAVESKNAQLALGYADFLWRWPQCFADVVKFNTQHVSGEQVALAVAMLEPAGYARCGEAPLVVKAAAVEVCYGAERDLRGDWDPTKRPSGALPPLPRLVGAQRALLEEMSAGALWDGGAGAPPPPGEAAACPWAAPE